MPKKQIFDGIYWKRKAFGGDKVVRIKSFYVFLPDLYITFNQEKLLRLQEELDAEIGMAKTGLDINYTPFSKDACFTVAVWALGASEEENVEIIRTVEVFLMNKGIIYKEYESYLTFHEDKIYMEIEAHSRKKIG